MNFFHMSTAAVVLSAIQVSAGQVKVTIPDDSGATVNIGGPSVEAFELVEFDGKTISVIARSGSGEGRIIRLVIVDGQVSLVTGSPGDGHPIPPGPDSPTIPRGHLGFTFAVYTWAMELVDPEADTARQEHAKAQALNYADIADGLVSEPPSWATVADAFAALRKRNREIVTDGPVRDAWAVFSGRISEKIEGLWPFSMEEAAKILRAIGAGLEAVE